MTFAPMLRRLATGIASARLLDALACGQSRLVGLMRQSAGHAGHEMLHKATPADVVEDDGPHAKLAAEYSADESLA
jgi:hypothetical protein